MTNSRLQSSISENFCWVLANSKSWMNEWVLLLLRHFKSCYVNWVDDLSNLTQQNHYFFCFMMYSEKWLIWFPQYYFESRKTVTIRKVRVNFATSTEKRWRHHFWIRAADFFWKKTWKEEKLTENCAVLCKTGDSPSTAEKCSQAHQNQFDKKNVGKVVKIIQVTLK